MRKKGKQIPLEIIEKGLHDSDCDVRTAAIHCCKAWNIPVPVTRTIEPPETVYKKCVGGVIVCAHIPEDAEVRGSFGNKCRASKAIITNVIGDFCGEPVGISMHDNTVCYYAGDEIEIDDFDYSDWECSAGFHFFCMREEAENY